jgi:hypothetical protein
MSAFSAREKLSECREELAWRRTVWARWVQTRAMTQADMDRRIAILEDMAEDYRRQIAAERKTPSLFAHPHVANDRGMEPLGQIAERVIATTLAELEQDASAARQFVGKFEAGVERIRRLGAEIHSTPQREAAE